MAVGHDHAEAYEAEHVHEVYEQIASHFSSTRYKPWPIVEQFLLKLPAGSIGLDVGCGNGKYLTVNRDVFIVASDRSHNLINYASQHQPHTALVADCLSLPHPPHSFDFAISIAAIHHLSTPERRVQAIEALLETLTANGQALIFVWALEQKSSRRGWGVGHDQDVMVPWVMTNGQAKSDRKARRISTEQSASSETGEGSTQRPASSLKTPDQQAVASSSQTYNRYYHLYRKGELEDDIDKAGGVVVDSGYERDNWWAILRLR